MCVGGGGGRRERERESKRERESVGERNCGWVRERGRKMSD